MNRNFDQTWQTLRKGIAPAPEDAWIRVGMDSGGIAAGAERLFEHITREVASAPGYGSPCFASAPMVMHLPIRSSK